MLTNYSDDPWNQTAADNAEWLQRFKRDVGILQAESGPGLTQDVLQWNITDGGTGFAPPYVCLSPQVTLEPLKENPVVYCRDSSKPFEPDAATANRYLQALNQRYAVPAKVFCSRELENGLTEYVKREAGKTGVMPTDDQLRERAKQIMSMQKTAADDPILLQKFKASIEAAVMSTQISDMQGLAEATIPPVSNAALQSLAEDTTVDLVSALPSGAELHLSDEQINDILNDIDPTFTMEQL